MFGIPHMQIRRFHRCKFRFGDDALMPQLQMFVEEVVHRLTGVNVVIVGCRLPHGFYVGFRAEQFVGRLNFGEAFFEIVFRPIPGGGGVDEGLGGERGRQFHIVGADAQQRIIFADASALMLAGGNHVDRGGAGQAVVNGHHHKRLGAATAGTGDRNAGFVDVRQRFQKIQRADAVPGLQSKDAQAM